MTTIEMHDPHHVTADYEGQPGARIFYLQFEDDHQRIDVLVEKLQVAGLANLLQELLARVDDRPATDWDRSAMALREPLEPRWRGGEIGVGLDLERGRFVIELTELVSEEEREPEEFRAWCNQDQARRLAAHAEEVVAKGRPACRFCGRPMEPDGAHTCPASNGHGSLTR